MKKLLAVLLGLSTCTPAYAEDVPRTEPRAERAKKLRQRYDRELQKQKRKLGRDGCYAVKIPDRREVYFCDSGHFEPEVWSPGECTPISAVTFKPWSPWQVLVECRKAA
jgi:hypothetical protein